MKWLWYYKEFFNEEEEVDEEKFEDKACYLNVTCASKEMS